mmetsp:Transcript_29076/g.51108  ORF Transcript_29076/g.51108 Transcript_29076/m.51108 type:complete len:157 (+) Transcript_29076:282-752(+)|eukprot:CAMPEP_0197515158 /NCGR_PEP_ID=MMETSP1318-20131121/370_1 /TAXON_ID=552666 /ORGANISM="Partenskyella glossopodia, Strain RCC365" /LENGTH=156 /DNA_ID=CAMNT_0043063445 /DNA_START=271 /DNA_END=741 /DNA_ORIENTATION=+
MQLSKPQVLKLGYMTILLVSVGYVIACWATAAHYMGSSSSETSRYKFIAIWVSLMVILSSLFMTYTLLFQAGQSNSPVAEAYIGASLAMLFMMCNSSIITTVQWSDPDVGQGETSSYQALAAMAAIYATFSFVQLCLLFFWQGPCASKEPEVVGSA